MTVWTVVYAVIFIGTCLVVYKRGYQDGIKYGLVKLLDKMD